MAFIWRHKNKLLFIAALIGGGYIGMKYIWKKMQELKEKEAASRKETRRFQDHFHGNCVTAVSAVKELLPSLQVTIQRELDTEAITQTLRGRLEEPSTPANKQELWQELKIISFVRFVGGVYTYALLLVFMRVQLAVLGGTMLRGVVKGQTQREEENREHKAYLAIVQHLLKDGVHSLLEKIRSASEQVLAHYSLKQQLSHDGVMQLVRDICQQTPLVSHSPRSPNSSHSALLQRQPHFLLKHTLPKEALLTQSSDARLSSVARRRPVRQVEEDGSEELLLATRDIVESAEMEEVLEECVDAVFTHSNKILVGSLTSASCQKNSPDLPLATVIPIVCDTSLCVFQPHGNTGVLLQELLGNKSLQSLARNIYEAFSFVME